MRAGAGRSRERHRPRRARPARSGARTARPRRQSGAFVTADMTFHSRIAQISANPILVATSQSMLRWLFQYHGVLLHWSGREKVTLHEHDDIVDLIAARDADGAVAAMQAHLDRSNPLYLHANVTNRAD
ncbi:FCD domain-containing protein [Paracoccus aerius]|uniref:FCD domain-containing protein n=1 Tax=Paracoccus aerius TaxID=1915382 RepID=UPI0036216042